VIVRSGWAQRGGVQAQSVKMRRTKRRKPAQKLRLDMAEVELWIVAETIP
jgi:hypothetical protein